MQAKKYQALCIHMCNIQSRDQVDLEGLAEVVGPAWERDSMHWWWLGLLNTKKFREQKVCCTRIHTYFSPFTSRSTCRRVSTTLIWIGTVLKSAVHNTCSTNSYRIDLPTAQSDLQINTAAKRNDYVTRIVKHSFPWPAHPIR